MKVPDWVRKTASYIIARAQEPSFYRGMIPMVSGASWASMDGSSRGEFVAAIGLFLAGFVQAMLPQDFLYRTEKK